MNVLLADDHAIVREGLKQTILRISPDTRFLEAADAHDVIEQLSAAANGIDLLMLDFYMPGSNGFQLLGYICDSYPDLTLVVVSSTEDMAHIRKCIDWGASGFIPKTMDQDEVIQAIIKIMEGGVFLPPGTFFHSDNKEPLDILEQQSDSICKLTMRQTEVLALLACGRTNKEIAQALGLSEYTVKIHIAAIFKALGVSNRMQAVLKAKRHGLIESVTFSD